MDVDGRGDNGDADVDDGKTTGEDAKDERAEVESGDEGAEEPEPALPPVEPAELDDLLAAYHQRPGTGRARLPWSWATLSPGEREALAAVLDGFVRSYNQRWALTDAQSVPPCWRRHPALAYDLAALAWAYYQAYLDPAATADSALRFQAHLPRFAERIDRWLGADPGECRAGRHSRAWRGIAEVVSEPDRTSVEDSDAVMLLGAEQFGFR